MSNNFKAEKYGLLPTWLSLGLKTCFPRWVALCSVLCLALCLQGCLKTRPMLREEESEERHPASNYKPIAAQPPQEIPSQFALDEIKVTLTQVEGRLQELERTRPDASESSKLSATIRKLETRQQQLETSLANLTQSQASLEEAVKALQSLPVLSNPDEVFNEGKTQFDSGNYSAAAETFEKYMKIPKASKIEEATFMRATSFYKLKDYKKAIVDFSKFPEKFPKSPRTPEALYKIALCFEALDMKEDARGFYQEILDKYPKSPEAKKAKKKVK